MTRKRSKKPGWRERRRKDVIRSTEGAMELSCVRPRVVDVDPRAYEMPVTKILEMNSLKDIQDIENRVFEIKYEQSTKERDQGD